jgi:thiamine biosynthesis lipoprotein
VQLWRYPFQAMGSSCELRLYALERAQAEALAEAGIAEVRRLERKYSRYRDDSTTAAINRSAGDAQGLEVDDETAALLDYAGICWEQSGGLFDITSGVLRRAWDFKSSRLPAQAEIDALRPRIGWQRVRWRRPRLALPVAGMELDFGGYVKEYAADRVAELCRARGARAGLVDLGGDLCVIGPHPDGEPWRVGIRHPRRPEQAMATLELASGGIATSGDYERFMVVGGRRYAHILSPLTGWPVEGLASVSVAAPHTLVAGSASTIAMLKGRREGPRWLDALGLPNLRMDQDGRLSGTLRPSAAARARCGSDGRPGPRA